MKTTLKTKRIPNDFKQIDSTNIIVNKSPKKRVQNKQKTVPFYQMEAKLSSLAEPKNKPAPVENEYSHWEIKESALKYKASKRIKKLAKPRIVNPKVCDIIKFGSIGSHSSVSPSALKYQPTERILELAKPKYSEFYNVAAVEEVDENVSEIYLLKDIE